VTETVEKARTMEELIAVCSSRGWYWNISGRDGLILDGESTTFRTACIFGYTEQGVSSQLGSAFLNHCTDHVKALDEAVSQALATFESLSAVAESELSHE
jgi:hypothetical protein